MKPVLKNIRKELNDKEGGRKNKYVLTYENSKFENYAYSNYDQEDFLQKISSLNITICNEEFTEIIVGSTFSYGFNKTILKPIHYSFDPNEEYNSLQDAVAGSLFKLFSRSEFRVMLNTPYKFIVNDVILNDAKQDDDICVSVTVVLDNTIYNLMKDIIYKHKDESNKDTKITIMNQSVGSFVGCAACKRVHLAFSDIEYSLAMSDGFCEVVNGNLTLITNISEIMLNNELIIVLHNVKMRYIGLEKDNANTSMKPVDNKSGDSNDITLSLNILVEDYSQVLSLGSDQCCTCLCKINKDIAKYIKDVPSLLLAVVKDKCDIDDDVLDVAMQCNLSNINYVSQNNDEISADILISDIKDYVRLSKINKAEWVDLEG